MTLYIDCTQKAEKKKKKLIVKLKIKSNAGYRKEKAAGEGSFVQGAVGSV
jgi:hypothetical protein